MLEQSFGMSATAQCTIEKKLTWSRFQHGYDFGQQHGGMIEGQIPHCGLRWWRLR